MDNFYGTIAYAGIVYLITTVSGILMLLAWRFFFRKLDHQGGLGVIYHVQRLILLLFLLPVLQLALLQFLLLLFLILCLPYS